MVTIAGIRTLTKKAGVLTGSEFRYIRSAGMLLSQPALGKLMGIDGQSVARWEKTGKVPKWAGMVLSDSFNCSYKTSASSMVRKRSCLLLYKLSAPRG